MTYYKLHHEGPTVYRGPYPVADTTGEEEGINFAALIVRAVNSHEELLAALKGSLIIGGTDSPYAFNMCYWCSSAKDEPHEEDCAYTDAKAAIHNATKE